MNLGRRLLLALALSIAAACGSSNAPKSNCGHPGDHGNSLGVGKYCSMLSDCSSNTKATLCTIIGDPNNFFCTFACKKDGPTDQCGEMASCQCTTACGCYPDICPH